VKRGGECCLRHRHHYRVPAKDGLVTFVYLLLQGVCYGCYWASRVQTAPSTPPGDRVLQGMQMRPITRTRATISTCSARLTRPMPVSTAGREADTNAEARQVGWEICAEASRPMVGRSSLIPAAPAIHAPVPYQPLLACSCVASRYPAHLVCPIPRLSCTNQQLSFATSSRVRR
jgi:hypothetical protein